MITAASHAPTALLADLRAARQDPDPARPAETLERWGLRALTGGRQNHVYAWSDPDRGPVCVKVYYKRDERRRAEREWAALTLLAQHDVDEAPAPLWFDTAGEEPAIGMSMVPGTCILDSPDVAAALKATAHATSRIQAVAPAGLLAALERIDNAAHYIARLTGQWPAQLQQAARDPHTAQMLALLERWRESGDGELLLSDPSPRILSRGDANLLNWLDDEGAISCVDFEFAGYSTAAFDAADLIEHISARAVGDEIWQDLLPELGVTSGQRATFDAAQRTCALRWLAVLWKQRRTRREEFAVQRDRVLCLQSQPSAFFSLT